MKTSPHNILVVSLAAALAACQGVDPTPQPVPNPTPVVHIYRAEWSAARNWNEALLAAIRRDLARPPVHARNLFHTSVLMYDVWAVLDPVATPLFLGRSLPRANGGTSTCALTPSQRTALQQGSIDPMTERSIAIAYGMNKLLHHRFASSPNAAESAAMFDTLMTDMKLDPKAKTGSLQAGTQAQKMAALGNYMADCLIDHGMKDGANEAGNYANQTYTPANGPLFTSEDGTSGINDPDRWQPLSLQRAIDQAGNPLANVPSFVCAEWGGVVPFAMSAAQSKPMQRGGFTWPVFHDPGPPARLRGVGADPEAYKWNHAMVLQWSSHLDPSDGVMQDISPATLGNSAALPTDLASYKAFYNVAGGVMQSGHTLNPKTGQPYAPNVVPRGDYTRVLSEFWADGPKSETPPGHWFVMFNHLVSDHPQVQKRYRGQGPVLDALEWDVKAYFALAGALHDAAITAWGLKGFYDSIRPISANRFMAAQGQSSDPAQQNYHPEGLPLIAGAIELVAAGDPLAGPGGENVGKVKVKAWKGTVGNPATDVAGVGWILAEKWLPYQPATFVTPPFAGYISGHSTYSRAAAEVLTAFTGDAYFPGGLGEFTAKKDTFLRFERGPSVDVTLQWATYRDASDQTSLSRIWGGIHPPMDDIPGRTIGTLIAQEAFTLADKLFRGEAL